jgi:hypothetical protein
MRRGLLMRYSHEEPENAHEEPENAHEEPENAHEVTLMRKPCFCIVFLGVLGGFWGSHEEAENSYEVTLIRSPRFLMRLPS